MPQKQPVELLLDTAAAAAAASARLFQRLEKATAAIYIYYYIPHLEWRLLGPNRQLSFFLIYQNSSRISMPRHTSLTKAEGLSKQKKPDWALCGWIRYTICIK